MSVGAWDLGKEMVENDENHDFFFTFSSHIIFLACTIS